MGADSPAEAGRYAWRLAELRYALCLLLPMRAAGMTFGRGASGAYASADGRRTSR
jgi:hypothetical protein